MADPNPMTGTIELSDEQRRRRKARNRAIAIVLGLMVVVFYAVTVAKLGPSVLKRPL